MIPPFPSSAKPQFILMVGDGGVLFVPCNVADAAAPLYAPAADEKGAASILAALARRTDVPVTLLADTAAQDFRRETLPHLGLLDRPKLIRRRLQSAFPQTRLAAHLDLKSDRTQILLAGLHEGGPVFAWLERLAAVVPDAAPRVCLLPVEGAGMAARLMPEAADGWGLFASLQRGGCRQIVTHGGELVFTRLTPLAPDAGAAGIVETVRRDIHASRGYLGRFGLTDSLPLHATLLMPLSAHKELRAAMLPVQSLTLLSPHEAAFELNLPFAPDANSPYGELLYAGWLCRQRRPRLPLMLPETGRTQRATRARRRGMRAAAAVFLVALGLTGWRAGDLVTTVYDRHREAARLAWLETRLEHERKEAGPVTEPLGRLRAALARQRLFASPAPAPWAALRELGAGLGGEAKLVRLDWQNDGGRANEENLRVEIKIADAPQDTDRQAAVTRFRQVAQNIARAMPDYSVSVARYPFPALPEEALSNGPGDGAETGATAELSIVPKTGRRAAP